MSNLDEHDDCPNCGSSRKDREGYRTRNKDDGIPLGLKSCPYCGTGKCCMCDGGNDVRCMSCENDPD